MDVNVDGTGTSTSRVADSWGMSTDLGQAHCPVAPRDSLLLGASKAVSYWPAWKEPSVTTSSSIAGAAFVPNTTSAAACARTAVAYA